ncbi:MAG TPA: hypothetical protein PKG80_09710, partial [Acidobacteriota bacterium]|nr:hypothetical protein [Acidobacteriota bacterium]
MALSLGGRVALPGASANLCRERPDDKRSGGLKSAPEAAMTVKRSEFGAGLDAFLDPDRMRD